MTPTDKLNEVGSIILKANKSIENLRKRWAKYHESDRYSVSYEEEYNDEGEYYTTPSIYDRQVDSVETDDQLGMYIDEPSDFISTEDFTKKVNEIKATIFDKLMPYFEGMLAPSIKKDTEHRSIELDS